MCFVCLRDVEVVLRPWKIINISELVWYIFVDGFEKKNKMSLAVVVYDIGLENIAVAAARVVE